MLVSVVSQYFVAVAVVHTSRSDTFGHFVNTERGGGESSLTLRVAISMSDARKI